MHDFADKLGVPRYAAVGIMEMLWHCAAERTPQGDIGSLPESAIAEAVCWKKKPDLLLNALVESRWLDRDPEYKYILHDWPDHCEQLVVKLLDYREKDFLSLYGKSIKNRQKFSRKSHPSREAQALAEVQVFLEPEKEKESKPRAIVPSDAQREDPLVEIASMLRQWGQKFNVPVEPDVNAVMRLARKMYDTGKNLDDFEAIVRELIDSKQKPKGLGHIITVIEGKLSYAPQSASA